MDQKLTQESEKSKEKKKGIGSNTMLFIIMSCWLLFYMYTGSKGGG